MPRKSGLRDDDLRGRLNDIERRLDDLEAAAESDPPKKKPTKQD